MAYKGEVYKAICSRLRQYHINVDDHVADEAEIEAKAPLFPNTTIKLGRSVRSQIAEDTTVLGGITFRVKNFQNLWAAFRNAMRDGREAFHYHELSNRGLGEQIYKHLINFDPLHISYAATEAGMPGEKQRKAWGFREVTDLSSMLDDRKLSMSDVRPDRRFAAKFAPPVERRVDITSLHVALTPEACNIHIDNVGFVLRGPNGVAFMSPDFLQHLVNELIFQTKLRPYLGDWVTEHFSLLLPSSDNEYSRAGLGFQYKLGSLTIGASLTFGCRCFPSHKLTLEERMIPIPEGWSVGGSITGSHDILGGGPLKPPKRR